MNLPLDIIRTRGRAAAPPSIELLAEIEPADLVALTTEKGSTTPPLKRLRDRHHGLARLLAEGRSEGEAAAITGYDISRVSILKNDPAFAELVKFYRSNVEAAYANMHEQLAGLSLDATLEIRTRLEEEPEKVTMNQLLEITKMGADRTGHGPTSTVKQDVNINLASRLDEARKRVAARTIEHTP